MSGSAEFAPLRPRQAGVAAAPASADVKLDIALEPPMEEAIPSFALEQPVPDPPVLTDSVPREPPVSYTEEQLAEAVREEAIRFASIATARALRVALLDAAALTGYVDDALRACGRIVHPIVHLHPADARAYRPQRDVEIVADPELERGEIAVAIGGGSIGATIEERAELLVRAAACA
jgi:hypothetical protein